MRNFSLALLLIIIFLGSSSAKEQETRWKFNYYSLEKPVISRIDNDRMVVKLQIVIMTHYDDRVIQNVKVHQLAIRAGIQDVLQKKTEKDWKDPNFKQKLSEEVRLLFNTLLEKYEGFGGIEELMFQEFELYTKADFNRLQAGDQRQRPDEKNLKKLPDISESTQTDVSPKINDSRRRLALVMANGGYTNLPRLPNAINDGYIIAKSLRSAGFQVSIHENLDLVGMQNAIRTFGEKLGKKDVGLVYYAGHAVQVKGKNYLIPVRENIKKSFEVPASAVDVDLVLATLEHIKNDLNIVVLDACRSSFPGEARGASRGLATIEAAKGTFIAFATAPGKEAMDGTGSNSPYTKHLSRLIGQKGLPLEQVFKEVRKAVVAETNGEQVPWENSSLMGDFYFTK
jgi:flagellar basal body-associated protein FliL